MNKETSQKAIGTMIGAKEHLRLRPEGKVASLSRRKWLARLALFLTAGFISSQGRTAEEPPHKASKDVVKYQDRPNDGQTCGMCKFYVPAGGQAGRGMMSGGGMMQGGGMMAPGTCEVVDGSISPMGWCTLYQRINT